MLPFQGPLRWTLSATISDTDRQPGSGLCPELESIERLDLLLRVFAVGAEELVAESDRLLLQPHGLLIITEQREYLGVVCHSNHGEQGLGTVDLLVDVNTA